MAIAKKKKFAGIARKLVTVQTAEKEFGGPAEVFDEQNVLFVLPNLT